MPKIQIKLRFSDKIIFEGEYSSTKEALVDAVSKKANLDGANLVRANLYGANLDGANLVRANLDGANLVRANLYGANLDGANLDGANLDGANLVRANLDGANLYGANLVRANLDGANLYGEKLKITPITMGLSRWIVLISGEYMKIGCERHSHADWAGFDRLRISQMDSYAWDWWQEHKELLLMACALHKKQSDAAPVFETEAA